MLGIVRGGRLDPRQILKQLGVPSRRRLAELEDAIELLQLAEADRGLNVRPPVVEADADVMEPAAAVVGAALVAQAAQYLPLLFRVRHDHSTFARRHLLVRIEGEDGRSARASRAVARGIRPRATRTRPRSASSL